MQNALASLPKTLDDTYARILKKIADEYEHYTKRLLQFLSFSERPLSIEEAVDVIAVETETNPHFNPEKRMPDPDKIMRYCSSLVIVIRRERTEEETAVGIVAIQLAHSSVKEYLTSDRLWKDIAKDLKETTARASIAQVCLAYLLEIDQNLSLVKIRQSFPLAQYAAQYWLSRTAVLETCDEKLCKLALEFFSCRIVCTTCYRLHKPDQPWLYDWEGKEEISKPPLSYASFGDSSTLLRCYLRKAPTSMPKVAITAMRYVLLPQEDTKKWFEYCLRRALTFMPEVI